MRGLAIAGVVAVAAAAGTAAVAAGDDGYEVDVVLPSATNLIPGGDVLVEGHEAGTIADITPDEGQARVSLAMDEEFAPLHSGAVATVEWRAVLGERRVAIEDGPDDGAEIPSGGMLEGAMPQPMEIDQVLAALDEPTRQRVNDLLHSLQGTLDDNEAPLNDTLRSSGPALEALGEVLRGLGTDGPAIEQLAIRLEELTGTLAQREGQVTDIVDGLSAMSEDVAAQQEELGTSLDRLPGTLRQARSTLERLPGTVDETVPLLEDLEPATSRLPGVAEKLRPVLRDLRPLAGELGPTLDSAEVLLQDTPGLLDSAGAVLPRATSAVSDVQPALEFLRPYTPELAGLVSNWNSALGNYNEQGRFGRIQATFGTPSANVNPGAELPGMSVNERPRPGEPVGQPWTDASGSGMR
ncbi:MCE family protein [Haloechinothrix sp. YIM 98757]|uniref:MCE family protein n=1 Tax=Haloechinothrix aidingensis TaxID=2752311 RepID=A0A838AB88_9PSEU|nr:MlaD family protein [Haloechinothrix aidingensis]MBA0126501.1 MCE family protein [Haloechinothrix aidingensis]